MLDMEISHEAFGSAGGQRAVRGRKQGTDGSSRRAAPGASLGAAPQVTKGPASSDGWLSTAGQSPQISWTTLVVPDPAPTSNARLSRQDRKELKSLLTSRDLAVLIALARYRYLDIGQLQQLFFPSERTAQMRIRRLKDLSLVHRWRLLEPNFFRHPSVLMLSPRGAAAVAGALDRDPSGLIEQARAAAGKPSRYLRVLRANWFFINLTGAADPLRRHGLYQWVGAPDLRHQGRVDEERRDRPKTDGWGRFLFPDGDVTFDLDFGRADLPKHWLRRRTNAYFSYFMDRRDAELCNVLFVAWTERGEGSLVRAVRRSRLMFVESCHRSWVTTVDLLRREGPLGPICRYAPCLAEEPDGWRPPSPDRRLRLDQFPKRPASDSDPRGCVGRPSWWDYRPAGVGGR